MKKFLSFLILLYLSFVIVGLTSCKSSIDRKNNPSVENQDDQNDVLHVTFNVNETSYVEDVEYGTCVSIPDIPDVEGYLITAWRNGTDLFDFKTVITEDLVINAELEEVEGDFVYIKDLDEYLNNVTDKSELVKVSIADRNFNFESLISILRNHNDVKVSLNLLNCIEVTEIPEAVFECLAVLTKVKLGYYIEKIGFNAFSGNENLDEVEIRNGCTIIGSSAFYGCSKLEKIILPETVTKIDNSVFYECRSLKEILIPDSVTDMGNSVFEDCTSLTSVKLPSGLTEIPNWCFNMCSSLKEITLPDGVTHIGDFAFSNCQALTDISFLNSITTIGKYAFAGCEGLKEVCIPSSVKYINGNIFDGCISLGKISVDENNTEYESPDSCNAVIEKKTDKLIIGCKNSVIPDKVKILGTYSFYRVNGLESLEIPKSVVEIEQYALPESRPFIYYKGNIEDWIKVKLSDDVSGKKLYINEQPATSITTLDLTDITEINSYSFYEWSGVQDIKFSPNTTSIGRSAFYKCTGLTEITLPENLKSIGAGAFFGISIETLIIPEGVIVIEGSSTFAYCSNLKKVVLPSTLKQIADFTFNGCQYLSEVILPEGLEVIGGDTFQSCIALENITIPSTVRIINYGAFSGCSKLKSFKFPKNIVMVGSQVFRKCSSLKELTIPKSIRNIDTMLYSKNSSITKVYYEGTEEEWASVKKTYLPSTVTVIYNYSYE